MTSHMGGKEGRRAPPYLCRRIIGAAMLGLVAFWFARALNIPFWRQWEPGDASDIALFTFAAAMFLSSRPPPPEFDRRRDM